MSVRKPRHSRAVEQDVQQPITPVRKTRHSLVYAHSPLLTPSLSASQPFDWEAAKGHGPPPYQTPTGSKNRRMRLSTGVGTSTPQSNGVVAVGERKPRKSRIIIRQGWKQWLMGLPSQWWLRISMLHHDLPLPPARTMGRTAGIALHLLHGFAKWWEISKKLEEDDGWGELDVRSIFADEGGEEEHWLSWTMILACLLVTIGLANALRLFTQTRKLDLLLRDEGDPITSPNITLVPSPAVRLATEGDASSDPTVWTYLFYVFATLWRWTVHAWRFLLHHPGKLHPKDGYRGPFIQQLELWDPSDLEMTLFVTYSPLHAVLWHLTRQDNWIIICFVMVMTTFQLGSLSNAYAQRLKDEQIRHAELMHEYDYKFVSPHLNPIKKDACVMTHESEMIHYPGYTPRR